MSSYVLAIDVETTGLDEKKHRIIQIGGVALQLMHEDFRVIGILDLLVNPGDDVEVSDEITGITGLTRAAVNNGLPIESAMKFVQEFLHLPFKEVKDIPEAERGDVLQHLQVEVVGHNLQFDLKFLGAEAVRLGRVLQVPGMGFCTMKMGMHQFDTGGRRISLGSLCERLGVLGDVGVAGAHDAFRDAAAAAACLRKMRADFRFLKPSWAPNTRFHSWDIWRAVNAGATGWHGGELQQLGLIRVM